MFSQLKVFAVVTALSLGVSVKMLAATASAVHPHVLESYGKLPLSFEANQGQTDSRVKFLSRFRLYAVSDAG